MVLLNKGPASGNIAVIVEIIDHNRVRIPPVLTLFSLTLTRISFEL